MKINRKLSAALAFNKNFDESQRRLKHSGMTLGEKIFKEERATRLI
jgi:hypothetical protein